MNDQSPYLHPEYETLSREELARLQLERLQQTVRQCMNSPFYKKRFDEMGLKPEDIRSLEDVRKLSRQSRTFGIPILSAWRASL